MRIKQQCYVFKIQCTERARCLYRSERLLRDSEEPQLVANISIYITSMRVVISEITSKDHGPLLLFVCIFLLLFHIKSEVCRTKGHK